MSRYRIISYPKVVGELGVVFSVHDELYDIDHRITLQKFETMIDAKVNRSDIREGALFDIGRSFPTNKYNGQFEVRSILDEIPRKA